MAVPAPRISIELFFSVKACFMTRVSSQSDTLVIGIESSHRAFMTRALLLILLDAGSSTLCGNRVEQRLCNSFVRCGFCRKISKKRGMVCIISLFTDEVFLTNLSFQHLLFFVVSFIFLSHRGEGRIVSLIRFLCCRYFLTSPSFGHLPYMAAPHPAMSRDTAGGGV